MNLRYSYSKYTYPFVFVSFSFFNMLEKNMLKEWPLTELTPFLTGLKTDKAHFPGLGWWWGVFSEHWWRGWWVSNTAGPGFLPEEDSLDFITVHNISKWPKLTPGRVVRYSENLLWVDTSGVRHYFIKPSLWGQNQITISWKFISFDPHRGKV